MASDFDSSDFRVRLSATLLLGRTKPPGARAQLERVLVDPHPAVRAAAAASLGKLADRAAKPALDARSNVETSAGVKQQIRMALQQLADLGPSARTGFAVSLGPVRNLTDVRGVDVYMQGAAKEWALRLAPLVADTEAGPASMQYARSPVLRLDGQLRELVLGSANGVRQVRAQVEFSILRMPGQTLKGTLNGVATSRDTGGGRTLASLQELAVRGAVESALANAGPGLAAAAEAQ
jgi:HEAT repeats